ncbi:hypothetical protein [Streptomyces niveiscabiei]|uniref:hypothetical protein n=1 Tax=Streptomyces niveiscabiei TaxID=164115 RepID=UPI0029C9E17D|nr:hypothetical protein [Streptomyces niveiscabiei]
MDLALWISAGLLAFVALAGGVTKTFAPREKLAAAGLLLPARWTPRRHWSRSPPSAGPS